MAREQHAAAGAARGQGPDVPQVGTQLRRLRRGLVLALVAPTLVAVGTTSAQATHGEFEIDGNTTVEETRDWDTPLGTRVTDPSGSADDSNYTGGSKEFDHPDTWEQGTGTAAPKTDITDVYAYTASHDGGVRAYFGFRRVKDEGTVNYDVELNQEPNYSEDPARPTRTPGDLLVRFEQEGNGEFLLTLAYRWTLVSDAAWDDETCIEVEGYSPAAGWCRIPVAAAGFLGATGEDGAFAEGTFELSALLGGGACLPAYTMNIRSIPGESLDSELKDYVGAFVLPPTCWGPIGITNAAAATYDVAYDYSVVKSVADDRKTVAAGTNATFTYTVLLTAGDRQRSGDELGGTVTLTNPNGAPMVATLSVTATSGTGCTFPGVPDASPSDGLQVTAPAGSSSYVYTCTVTMPATDGTTTATVSWSETDYPSGTEGSSHSASADASYAFSVDQSTDEQTTVTDTFQGGGPQVLGTFSWADVYHETDAGTPPHTVVVATYTRTITAGAAGTCASHLNTAQQTENDTGQSDASQETVTVCAATLDVLPAEAQGSVGGGLRGTCQGTVRARMRNGFEDPVRFTLRIGDSKRHYRVKADTTRRVRTTAPARARVVLRARGKVIDRLRMPARCAPPEVLPATGLRATTSA